MSDLNGADPLMIKIRKNVEKNKNLYISPPVLRQIYRRFRQWRDLLVSKQDSTENTKINYKINLFMLNVVKYLLERCYWINYGDSDVIAYLLTLSYELMEDLGHFYDYREPRFGSSPQKAFFVKTTWRLQNLNLNEVNPIDYFMEHSNKKKLLFGGKRFSEQSILALFHSKTSEEAKGKRWFSLRLPPCSLSFQYPEHLLILLKYGLFVNAGPKDVDVGKLLTGIIGVFLNYPASDSGEFALSYTNKIKTMGDYLLRAVMSVDPAILMKCQRKNRIDLKRLFETLQRRKALPSLKKRCQRLQTLQHLCRCQIRRVLYDCWTLPSGIQRLSVTDTMRQYLELERD